MNQTITITFEDEQSGVKYSTSFSGNDLTTQDELLVEWLTSGAWEAIGFAAVKQLFEN